MSSKPKVQKKGNRPGHEIQKTLKNSKTPFRLINGPF